LNQLLVNLITKAHESDSVSRVSEIAPELPSDIEALHVLLAAARAERDAAIAERDQALSQIDRLRHLLRQLQRAQFGRRSEKLDPEQLLLALEDIEQAIAANEAAEDKKDPGAAKTRAEKRRVNRGALPSHLPRVDMTIEPEDTNCPCCRSPMHVIGEETSERLDVIPAQFRVIVTHRPKYACRACEEAVVQAPAPERLIKGGLPTEAMVAYVLVAKYAWHLPLYRQTQMLLAQGIDIKRAVLAFWVGYAAAELMPLYLRLRELILASARSQSMRRWCRCSIPDVAAPRKDTSGPSPATIGLGAGAIRPLLPTATRRVAAPCML
jgi:transposase